MRKEIKIGLFGFGCVGQGLWDVIQQSNGFKSEIVKICIKDKNKKRSLPAEFFTFDADEILDNPEINTIVELIDNAEDAYRIVTKALKSGKNVVTANKMLVANHLKELVELQKEYGVSLLYESSVCGSIPIIRNLEEYYDNELLSSVSGIFNGSSNYILSKVFNEKLTYEQALKQAQDLGFAESNPILDVGGFDSKFKLIIVALHSFGIYVNPSDVLNIGIQHVQDADFNYAREKGLRIKLVPTVKKISDSEVALFVLPQLVGNDNLLMNVENEFNGVIVEGVFAEKQFFGGKGAGGHPTGTAVLSDISALSYDYRYEYKKLNQNLNFKFNEDLDIEVYVRANNKAFFDTFPIVDIREEFKSASHSYAIGRVSLKDIKDNLALIEEYQAFIAFTGKYESKKNLINSKESSTFAINL